LADLRNGSFDLRFDSILATVLQSVMTESAAGGNTDPVAGKRQRGVARRVLAKGTLAAWWALRFGGGVAAYAAVEPVGHMQLPLRNAEVERFAGPDPRRTKWVRAFEVVAHKLAGNRAIDTVADMQRAFINSQVDAVDLDVRLAANGIPVLYHDRSMIKEGNPWPVELFDDGTLRRESIEALEAAYAALPANKSLALDVKKVYGFAGSTHRAMQAITDMLIADPDRRAQTRIWLENPDEVKEFRQILEADARAHPGDARYVDVQTGLSRRTESTAETRRMIDEAYEHFAQSISVRFDALDAETVQYAHDRNLYVYCWDLTPDQYELAIAKGVDCINADDPDRATTLMAAAEAQWQRDRDRGLVD
jgi:glycerophosphoryl diester phosphodiesterase